MRYTWLLVFLLGSILSCRSSRSTSHRPWTDASFVEASVHTSAATWQPQRPNWVSLPNNAPTSDLQAFEKLTQSLEDLAPRDVHRADETSSIEVVEAARFVRDHLPTMRWRHEIWSGADDIINGRLHVRRLSDIERSTELFEGRSFYLQYDGVHERLVYGTPEVRGLELRASLVYALAERAHLLDLAQLADIPSRALALTYRLCRNLQGEFKVVTHLQAMEALIAWAHVDPGLQRREQPPGTTWWAVLVPSDVSFEFTTIYASFELMLSRRPPEEQRRDRMADAFRITGSTHPVNSDEVCGRYVISRGPRRGHYLLPSDDLPEIIPILNEAPALLAPPPAPLAPTLSDAGPAAPTPVTPTRTAPTRGTRARRR